MQSLTRLKVRLFLISNYLPHCTMPLSLWSVVKQRCQTLWQLRRQKIVQCAAVKLIFWVCTATHKQCSGGIMNVAR
jgi:hypothetical protein